VKVDTPHAAETVEIIEEIWRRARINAFAHREAFESFTTRALVIRGFQIAFTLLSILLLILFYLASSADGEMLKLVGIDRKVITVGLTILSILFTFIALFLDIGGAELEWKLQAAEHRFLLGSYQHIAQRARECKWPDRPYDDLVELLRDLERDFQLLKARGMEPSDRFFVKANKLFEEVRRDPTSGQSQSFPPRQTDSVDGPSP